MSPSCCCLILLTSSTTSPRSTVVLFHSGSSSVWETTYLGIELNLSANSPATWGQTGAKPFDQIVMHGPPGSQKLVLLVRSNLVLTEGTDSRPAGDVLVHVQRDSG